MYANNNSPALCIVIRSSIYTYVFHFVHHKHRLVGHVLVTKLFLISNIRGSQPWATHSCRRGSHVGVQLPLWFSVRQAPQQNKHCSSWFERNGARFTELGCYISKKILSDLIGSSCWSYFADFNQRISVLQRKDQVPCACVCSRWFLYRFYHGKSPWKSHHLGNISSSSLQSPTKKFQVHWTPANCTHEIPRRDTPLGLKIRANYNDQTAEVTLKCGLVKENSPKIRTGYLIFRWSVLDMSLRCTATSCRLMSGFIRMSAIEN